MKAIWKDIVIAEAPKEDLVRIEGNWYFPPTVLEKKYFQDTSHHTDCHWKGQANYYNVIVDGETNKFGAWYYPHPKEGSIERVKKDFTGYVAFWNGIGVVE